jgi:hypothetical protein
MGKSQAQLRQAENAEAVEAKDSTVQLISYSAEAVRAPRNRKEARDLSAKVLKRAFS